MDNKKLSQFLCRILRHEPEVIGIDIEKYGAWANISELINGVNAHGKFKLDRALLEQIVSEDNKQRYKISDDGKKIRASQGHSIDVIIEMDEKEPPEILYHGTAWRNVDSIMKDGINSGERLYVHLSKDEPTAVTVGQRHGKPVILKIKSGDMYRQGHIFYLSENNIWLTKFIPKEFISVN